MICFFEVPQACRGGHSKCGWDPQSTGWRNMAKCIHEKEKSRCRECNEPGQGSFCLHGIIRGTCSSCEPEKAFLRCQRQAREIQLPFMLTEAQFRDIRVIPSL